MNHRLNRHSPKGLLGAPRHTAPMKPRWKNLGSCEVEGSVCEWLVHLAIRAEGSGLWSIRWQGEEQDEEVIGPDHLDTLAEIEERGIDRDELLNLFEFSGIKAVEDFAGMNRTS